MRRSPFDDLLRDIPYQVHLSPESAWVTARRRLRRRALAVSLSVAGILGLGSGLLTLRAADRIEPAPSPGVTFVRAERVGDNWEVLRSDGTKFTIDPRHDYDGATIGLSPDGRWLSYAQGPESGSILTLYLLRSEGTEPQDVSDVLATWGFAHVWSPDSRLVLVPVPDGDVNLVNTDRELVEHRFPPGTITDFIDNDSLGFVRATGSRGDKGLTWLETGLDLTTERSLALEADRSLLNPPGWPPLYLEQASLSPDRTRVAALLANPRGQSRLLVFSTDDGALIAQTDSATGTLDLTCPLRWVAGSAVLPRQDETCAISPG